jgi:hypothetical protein
VPVYQWHEDQMGPGGADELLGNGVDTEDNVADFVERTTRTPQSSMRTLLERDESAES